MAKQKPVTRPVTKAVKEAPKKHIPGIEIPPAPAGSLWIGLIAAALGFFLYANTFGHQYTLDDFSAIKENWVVKGGLENIGIIFSTEYRYGAWSSPGSLYRPIPLTFFAAEWQLQPDKPFLGHFINVLFFTLSGWVLWITWRRILSNYSPALAAIAVLVFMAHPVHTEVVANIKSLDEILALLGCTAALYAIWRHFETNNNNWLVAGALFYAFALFSKESAITFLAVFPLTIWYFTNQSIEKNLRTVGVMAIPAVIFLAIRWKVIHSQPYDEIYSVLDNFIVGATNYADRLASAFMMCWKYLAVLIFPNSLVHEMGFPQVQPVGWNNWQAILGFFVYAGMFIWAVAYLGRKHFLSFAILFYLIPFALFSNVVFLIGTSYGERLQYMPSFGFALAVGYGLVKLFKLEDKTQFWNKSTAQTIGWAVCGVLVLALGVKTISRNNAWFDSNSLYEADILTSPNSAKLNYHRSLEITKKGVDEDKSIVIDSAQVRKGIESYTRAIELYPQYHDAYGSRGLAWFRLGDLEKAYEDYLTSLKYRPNDAKVWSNLGYIYMLPPNAGGKHFDPPKAEEAYKKSIQYDPRFVDARRNLGAVLAMQRKFPEAIAQWQEGLKYEPNNVTLLRYIGSAYKDMGQPESAQPWLEKADRAQLSGGK